MVTYFSIIALENSMDREASWAIGPWGQRVGHDWVANTFISWIAYKIAFLLNSAFLGLGNMNFCLEKRKQIIWKHGTLCCGLGLGGQHCETGRELKIDLTNHKKKRLKKFCSCAGVCVSAPVPHPHPPQRVLYSRSLLYQEVELRE